MKTKWILVVLAGALLSSCAGKLGVMKRRYNKGFHVSVVKKQPATAKQQHERRATSVNAVSVQEPPIQEIVAAPLRETAPASSVIRQPGSTARATKQADLLASRTQQSARPAVFRHLDLDSHRSTKALATTLHAPKVEPIILVILSILIPPLAVYLFQDRISIDFWVDLILSFLFWLPGVVFALLVCFGGVSLE